MRSIKELLQLMLDNEHLFNTGLCGWISELADKYIVTNDEWDIAYKYIHNNRPIIGWIRSNILTVPTANYYWKPGNIKPRIKWLKKHIKKN